MSRAKLMEALRDRGVENPDRLVPETVSDESIEATIRWYDHERFRLGQKVGTGLLAWKLKEGGVEEDFDPKRKPTNPWWQTAKGRLEWIRAERLALRPPRTEKHDWRWVEHAEVAIISLIQAKKSITVDAVRDLAISVKAQQEEEAPKVNGHKPEPIKGFTQAGKLPVIESAA